MAQLVFTAHLRDIGPTDARAYRGDTVGAVLSHAFADYPRLRHYILDDQGRVRKHVIIFVDNEQVPREKSLTTPVHAASEIYVLQALSGG